VPRQPSFNCYVCPRDIFYKRSELRARKFKLYCPEHLPEKEPPWPHCPKCDDDDFGVFNWKGSPEKTTVRCEQCGFKDSSLNHFDAMTIKITVGPLRGSLAGTSTVRVVKK